MYIPEPTKQTINHHQQCCNTTSDAILQAKQRKNAIGGPELLGPLVWYYGSQRRTAQQKSGPAVHTVQTPRKPDIPELQLLQKSCRSLSYSTKDVLISSCMVNNMTRAANSEVGSITSFDVPVRCTVRSIIKVYPGLSLAATACALQPKLVGDGLFILLQN